MPSLPDYPGVLKMRFLSASGADAGIGTTLHFTYTGTAPNDGVCNDMANNITSAIGTPISDVMGSDTIFTGVQITDLTSSTSGFGEELTSIPGVRAGLDLPAAACVLVNQPFARRYRGGKSRTYWPWGTADDLDTTQTWLSASVTDFTFAFQTIIDACRVTTSGTTVVDLCSISYYHGFTAVTNPITGRTRDVPTVRATAIAPDVISTFVVNSKVASQRRRNLQA